MNRVDVEAVIAATEAEIARLETGRAAAIERLRALRGQRTAAADRLRCF